MMAETVERTRELKAALLRMRVIATLLLAVMAGVACLAAWRQDLHPAMGYLRAFAEAAMIGGLADWFAVTALFRRPFGLPIPHTAIIPRSQKRIARGVGDFVAANFFDRKAILARLQTADPVRRVAEWLLIEDNARSVAAKIAARIPAAMDAFGEEPIRLLFRDLALRRLSRIDSGLLSANMLNMAIHSNYHLVALDFVLIQIASFIRENRILIRKATADKSKWWVPSWADQKLADQIAAGLEQTFSEMQDKNHPWREKIDQALNGFSERLRNDPALRANAESVKKAILSNPEIAAFLTSFFARLNQDLRSSAIDGRLETALSNMILDLARRFSEDERLRKSVDLQLLRLVSGVIFPSSRKVGEFVSNVVEKWDPPTLVQKIELHLGRDLQYIRINGTIVGGLAGLVLHAIANM